MNLDKARDYFSAYFEGSLDRGLKQTFEARLKEDAQLQAEYRAFERTMRDLDAYAQVEVATPDDLHERISARLDRVVWEQRRAEKTGAFGAGWWKGILFGATAAAGILIMIVGINHSRTSAASALPTGGGVEQFDFVAGDRSVNLHYPPVNHRTIVIRDPSGQIQFTADLRGQGIESKPLVNNGDYAEALSIEADESGTAQSQALVALPGRLRDKTATGKGSLKDLALALANHYGTPVVVEASEDLGKDTSWDLSRSNLVSAAADATQPLGLAVSETDHGVLLIQRN